MGQIIDGQWVKKSIVTSNEKGAYDRKPRSFLDTISEDHPKFKPEANRYHLYVSLACPWAHRTLICRHLKGLTDLISVDVVHPDMLEMGWTFSKDFSGATGDRVNQKENLFEIYQKAQPDVTTSSTVPILWDKKTETIVNNESSEIIRIFNHAFNKLTGNELDLYPENLRSEIDEVNDKVYHKVNNGVYKSGFAKNQEAYEAAVTDLFKTLDELEQRLEGRYLVGEQLTEADVRLVTTLLRFDIVYYTHFKCNLRQIKDYPNVFGLMKRMYELDGVKDTTNFEHIKRHYYYSHEFINPNRIVPVGPAEVL